MLVYAEACHHALIEFTGKEAFEASNDLALGPAISGAACDVVDGRLMELHPDDDGSIEGGVGPAVAAPIQAMPASGHPRGGRDQTRAAEQRWLPSECGWGYRRKGSTARRRCWRRP